MGTAGRLIIVGTMPIVIVGGLFGDVIEARIRTPLVVAINLVIGAHRACCGPSGWHGGSASRGRLATARRSRSAWRRRRRWCRAVAVGR